MEVFLLATHYLDTFLSSVTITKSQFQLCAATCLLLLQVQCLCPPLFPDVICLLRPLNPPRGDPTIRTHHPQLSPMAVVCHHSPGFCLSLAPSPSPSLQPSA